MLKIIFNNRSFLMYLNIGGYKKPIGISFTDGFFICNILLVIP